MKERIILTVEWVEGDQDVRASMHIPYEQTTVIFGTWLDDAIRDLRSECADELGAIKRLKQKQSK